MVTFSVLLSLKFKYFTCELYTFQASWRSLDLIQLFRNVPSRCDDGADFFFHAPTISINRTRLKITTILTGSFVQILKFFVSSGIWWDRIGPRSDTHRNVKTEWPSVGTRWEHYFESSMNRGIRLKHSVETGEFPLQLQSMLSSFHAVRPTCPPTLHTYRRTHLSCKGFSFGTQGRNFTTKEKSGAHKYLYVKRTTKMNWF